MATMSPASATIPVSPTVTVKPILSDSQVKPTVEFKYVENEVASNSSASSGQSAAQEDASESTQLLQKEVLISPTVALPLQAPQAFTLDFFNPRVIGVLLGLIFLWIYVKRLKKKEK